MIGERDPPFSFYLPTYVHVCTRPGEKEQPFIAALSGLEIDTGLLATRFECTRDRVRSMYVPRC